MKEIIRVAIIAIISMVMGVIFLFLDIIDILGQDTFGFHLGAFLIPYFIVYFFFLFLIGAFLSFITSKIRTFLSNKTILVNSLVYLIPALIILVLFFISYNSYYHQTTTAIFMKFVYLTFLIIVILYSFELFKTKAKISIIIFAIVFIILSSFTFTKIPCQNLNIFCKYNYCDDGTRYDNKLGKCLENVENCIYKIEECFNNTNGKSACDFKTKKCVENTDNCIDNDYCSRNQNGKTICKDLKCIGP